MSVICTDEDIDTLIWTAIQGSTHAQDYLDYIRQANGRPAEYEAAFIGAEEYWQPPGGVETSQAKFSVALALIEEQAEGGNPLAMLHVGRCLHEGIGAQKDETQGKAWLKRGADLGHVECLIALGRYLRKVDGDAARIVLEQAVASGHLMAHLDLSEIDPQRTQFHLTQALASTHPHAYAQYGHYMVKQSTTDEEKATNVAWIRRGAEGGDVYAYILLAMAYSYGTEGCAQDHELAKYWCHKGCALGSTTCYWMLGHMGMNDKDSTDFEKNLRRASMLNDEWSQSLLGWHLVWRGKTVQAQQEGVMWLRAAANQGYKPAIYRLAEALREGRGTEVNNAEAIYWLQEGSRLGHSDCQCALGVAYLQGSAVEADFEKAHNLFQIASLQGEAWPLYLLGLTFEDGQGVAADLVMALRCFKEASQLGDPRATFKVGMAYYYGRGVEEDNPACATWLKKAAGMGNSDAQAHLGMMLIYGHGVERNVKLAMRWLKVAAEDDNRIALRELAKLYESGSGLRQDLEEATRLMAKSAALGDSAAKDWVAQNCPEKPVWLQDLLLANPNTNTHNNSPRKPEAPEPG
jgi:TPR repeat protein